MTEDQTFIVGEILPRIEAVSVHQGFQVVVTWKVGSRAGQSDLVDLAPAIMTYKPYAQLRGDPDLFRTVHVINHGTALGWGDDDRIDMSAEGVEDLVEQAMTAVDFRSFLERHRFTQEAAAAQLGISRRQVNYFLSSKAIPRTVALACAYLDTRLEEAGKPSIDESNAHEAPSCLVSSVGTERFKVYGIINKPGIIGDFVDKTSLRRVTVKGSEFHYFPVLYPADVTFDKSGLEALATDKPATGKP